MKNKIAIIVAYFGKFPNYFPLWLKSCGKNPTVDFIVVTDQELNVPYDNIIVKNMQLSDLQNKATAVLGFEAALANPYKCCDYRPLYGLLFADILFGYDYWGHCDIDLIFGDLQYFFDKYDLYSYDKFGTLGHLALYKNSDKMNNSYKTIYGNLDYRKVFTDDKNYAFDELGGIYRIHQHMNVRLFTKRIFVDIATIYKRYRIIDVYGLDERPTNYAVQTFSWENGKTYHVFESKDGIRKQEYIYIHFQKRPNYKILSELLDSDAFYITNHGFFPGGEKEPTHKEILQLNPYKGKAYEAIEGNYNLLYRKVRNYLKRRFHK